MLAVKIAKSQAKDAASVSRARPPTRGLGHDREVPPLVEERSGERVSRLVDPRRSIAETADPGGDPRPTDADGQNALNRAASARWSWDFGKIPLFAPDRAPRSAEPRLAAVPLRGVLQTKLVIGAVNDPLEREADAVADAVMRMPDPALSISAAPPQVSRKCAECEEEDKKKLQKKPEGGATTRSVCEAPPIVHEVLREPGRPLDPATRAFFEPRFEHDFGRVRVHTDTKSLASARAVNAEAYTVGHDIVFGARSFAPQTQSGRRLIAHELTHVVQQGPEGERPYQTVQRQTEPTGGGPGRGPDSRGSCPLSSGTIKWVLSPMVGFVNARIEFTPTAAVMASSKTISFIQTVTETQTSGGFLGLGSQTSIGATEVDVLPSDKDPFYGAKWDQAAGKWADEPSATQVSEGEGSRPATATTTSAVINDSPMLNVNETKRFETVATVVETGQVLGALRWTIQRWRAGVLDKDSSTTVWNVQCVEGASADFPAVVEKFYSGDGNVVLAGFAAGSADLPAAHPQTLAPVLDRLQKNPAQRVLLGGAATADEPQPAALSLSRAQNVKAYLVSQGIAESRIDVESYGADWARTSLPGAAQANRRVQIRLIR